MANTFGGFISKADKAQQRTMYAEEQIHPFQLHLPVNQKTIHPDVHPPIHPDLKFNKFFQPI